MNKNSIIFFYNFKLFYNFYFIGNGFHFLFSHENSMKSEQIFDRYKPIIKMINSKKNHFDEDFNKNLLDMNYKIFDSKEDIENILSTHKKIIFTKANKHGDFFKIFQIDGKYHLLFDRFNKQILIKDLESESFTNSTYIIFVFITLLLVITFLYIKTLKKLLPLKELKDKVINLGDEKFDFDFYTSSSKDEVALLANEFRKSAMKT